MKRASKKRFNGVITGLLFGSWVLLAFHTHKPHLRDLHPPHEACQLCVLAPRISQNALPLDNPICFSLERSPENIAVSQETSFSYPTFNSKDSRAPPQ